MQELEIVQVALTDIKPYKNNAKKHPEQQVANLAESIRTLGWRQPIVLDADGVIIIGHGRFLAAQRLGLETAPCHYATDLTKEQAKKLRLLDNKLNESEWDFDLLKMDIEGLDFSGMTLDWGMETEESATTFEEMNARFQERMASGELSEDSDEYQEFLAKFEAKKTTDDCYTPQNVYEVVADYVANHYGVDKANFVRPFYPGGDYQNETYKSGAVVVDNPPFSILSEICAWYQERGIPFFLFAPHMTVMGVRKAQKVVVGFSITYENGAFVSTSFVTNMDEYEIRSAPDLYKGIEEADKENLAKIRKQLPKYSYPMEVVRQTDISKMSKYGIEFAVKAESCQRISMLDAQKEEGKGIFGSGYILSERAAAERAAAERAAAERAAAEVFELSEREREIVRSLK